MMLLLDKFRQNDRTAAVKTLVLDLKAVGLKASEHGGISMKLAKR